jgi:hypothetical protein
MSYKDDGMIHTDRHHGKYEFSVKGALDGEDFCDCLLPPEEAIKVITDEWISEDHYCKQTIMDLRDALADMIEKNKKLEEEIEQCYRDAAGASI